MNSLFSERRSDNCCMPRINNRCLGHPREEALERFLLFQCKGEELGNIETHIVACDLCVTRLESLETQIAIVRLGLGDFVHDCKGKELPRERRWRNRLQMFASAAAAIAV